MYIRSFIRSIDVSSNAGNVDDAGNVDVVDPPASLEDSTGPYSILKIVNDPKLIYYLSNRSKLSILFKWLMVLRGNKWLTKFLG
jgi:hypothetical protein